MPGPLTFIVLGQVGGFTAPEPAPVLPTIRPAICRTSEQGHLGIWEQARYPGLARYCNLLSLGYSRLEEQPGEALGFGQQAQRLIANRAAPWLLMAQAERRSRRFDRALTYFHKALELDKSSIQHPQALRDYAIAELKRGQLERAVSAYRELIQKANSVPSLFERQRIFVEAALATMAMGKEGLAEAIGYLSELRYQTPLPAVRPYLLSGMALALSRAGRDEEAQALSAEAFGPWLLQDRLESELSDDEQAASRVQTEEVVVVPEREAHALIAVLSVGHDPDLLSEHLQAYLAQKDLPEAWRAHARHMLRVGTKAR